MKTYPPEIGDLLERVRAGDPAVLPELRKVFATNPELAARLGDLAGHAEQALLQLAAGDNPGVQEAICRHTARLRESLLATATGPLEKLLVERVVLSWLAVHVAEIEVAGRLLRQGEATPGAQAAQKRLDRADERLQRAIKSLATVTKLLRPALSPVQLASRLNGTPPSRTVGRDGLRARGVGTHN